MHARRLSTFKTFGILLGSVLCVSASALHAQAVTIVQTASRFAGTGIAGFGGDFGSSTSLSLNMPSYVVLDTAGNEYLSDTGNNCVRRIDTSGNVTTLAGLAISGQGDTCSTGSNPTPTAAQGLLRPAGLALDQSGNLYIADSGHNCIRRLNNGTNGVASLTTVAGTCSTLTTASSTPNPNGLAIDTSSNLYVALQDTEATAALSVNQVIRQSILTSNSQAVNTASFCLVAGTPSVRNALVCSGITDSVALSAPSGLALDSNVNLFVADTGNNCVRQIVGAAQATIVGLCANDGTGTSATALNAPYGLAFSRINSLFISEAAPTSNVYRYISSTGKLVLTVGQPSGAAGPYDPTHDGGSALNIFLNQPRGMVFDANNNFYLADSGNSIIRFLNVNYVFPATAVGHTSPSQPITYAINNASVNLTVTPGTDYTISSNTCTGKLSAAAAGSVPTTCQVFLVFAPSRPGVRNSPLTLTDSVSNTLVATGVQGIGTGPLGTFTPGIVNTVASKLANPIAIDTDSFGNAYVLEQGTGAGTADLRMITPSGSTSTLAIPMNDGLVTPSGVTTDAGGNWYIVDSNQGTVARYGSDGSISQTYVTGLIAPSAVFVDGFGNLYVAQQGTAHNVIEVYGSGLRRVVAGNGTDPAANNVPSTNALFSMPSGLYIDLNGVLYVSDSGTHRVYAIDSTGRIHVLAGNGTATNTPGNTALTTGIVNPTSVAVDAAGDVYIADSNGNKVYVVYSTSASGANNIATIIGNGSAGGTGDGGYSTQALVNGPLSLALDGSGDLFVVDGGNKSVREITYPNPTLNFGTVAVGTTSPVMTQQFLNAGTVSLNLLSAVSTTDPHFAVDTNTTTCGLAILSGQQCTLGYTFTPTTTAGVTAFSILSSNSYNSPEPITLKANILLALPANSAVNPETEVYGSAFPETSTFTVGSNPPVTGTLTYTTAGKTLCTLTGTLSPSSTCNAPNSGLSVGSYNVTVTYSGDANYAATTYTVTLQVTPAPLTVTTNNQTRPYGQPNPTLTGSVAGAVNGDSFTVAFATIATIASPVGTYLITATLTPASGTSLSNYTVTNPGGTLTITPTAAAGVTVTVNCVSKVYGAANPAFTATVTGALNGDTFTLTFNTTATTSSPVGSYPITVTVGGAAAANYTTITTVPCALTVTPAPTSTTLTSSSNPSALGTAVTFTATVTAPTSTIAPSATVNFYDGSTLLGPGTIIGNTAQLTTSSLPLGSQTITAVYPANTNYQTSSGSLTQIVAVPSGSFTISATPSFQLVRGAASTVYNVTVTSVSGFVGPVALTCAGFPTDGSCSFAPVTVQVSAPTPGTSVMTVTNTAADAALQLPGRPGQLDRGPVLAGIFWPYALSAFGLLFALIGLRKRERARGIVLLLLLGVTIAGVVGCGCPPAANRNYTLTITGTSVNGGPAAQSTQVSLDVGQAQ
jgi:sugar lactone lactonase YvrE